MKFILFLLLLGVFGFTFSGAYADHSEVTIEPVAGSAAPGCEETAEGCYIPNTTTVDVGGVVIMTNTDSAAHTFTSGTPSDGPDGIFDTSLLMVDGSYEWSPETPGEYPYFCMVHPWMTGLIIVQGEGSSGGSTGTISISTDDSSYQKGDTVFIKGTIDDSRSGIPMNLRILSPTTVIT